jgi:hypothetical protein
MLTLLLALGSRLLMAPMFCFASAEERKREVEVGAIAVARQLQEPVTAYCWLADSRLKIPLKSQTGPKTFAKRG